VADERELLLKRGEERRRLFWMMKKVKERDGFLS
jgi:hypothetical protein